MSEQMHKIPSASLDFKTLAAQQIAELFPEVVSDGKVDFDMLRTILGEDLTGGVTVLA